MPTAKSKRVVDLQSSATEFDASEFAADDRLCVGSAQPNLLVAEQFGPVGVRSFWLEGRGGTDTLVGSIGDDLLVASRVIRGDSPRDNDADTDNAIGIRTDGRTGRAGDTLVGGDGRDLLFGSDANDLLQGGKDDDFLYDFAGDDRLEGGAGDDTLSGDTGSNTLLGGAGLDTATWADLLVRDRPRDEQGVALNLTDQTIRYGFGPVDFLIAPGTASHRDASGFGADTLRRVERFDGTEGDSDIAFLDLFFEWAGMQPDGFTAYRSTITDETVFLRGFEDVVFA